MAQFININGTIINLDNVISIEWFKKHETEVNFSGLVIRSNTSGDGTAFTPVWMDNSRAAKKAYNWLKLTCMNTFTDEPENQGDELVDVPF